MGNLKLLVQTTWLSLVDHFEILVLNESDQIWIESVKLGLINRSLFGLEILTKNGFHCELLFALYLCRLLAIGLALQVVDTKPSIVVRGDNLVPGQRPVDSPALCLMSLENELRIESLSRRGERVLGVVEYVEVLVRAFGGNQVEGLIGSPGFVNVS